MNNANSFRSDINGLRAVAVLAVLFFHFQLPGFHAGFIGVDIFFVISGYLMTGIIVSQLVKSNFKLSNFYLSRFRRIIPALLFLVVILILLGWFWLPLDDYRMLGKEAITALAFYSNNYYLSTAGYFDTASHEKWLLHTWSLSIEMQFYMIYPLVILALWKVRNSINLILISLIAISLVSFAVNIYYSNINSNKSFYMLFGRIWELTSGGIVYLYLQKKNFNLLLNKFIFFVGLLLLIAAFVLINQGFSWPSYWGLLPVVGAALIIISKFNNRLLGNFIFQYFGKISYSLYLWHWPLVVVLYFTPAEQTLLIKFLLIGLSILLAHISYKYIETPSRNTFSLFEVKRQYKIGVAIWISILVLAIIIRNEKFEDRLPKLVEDIIDKRNDYDPDRRACSPREGVSVSPQCVYGNKNNVSAVVIGDSHALSVITAVREAAGKDKGVVLLAKSACPPIYDFDYIKKSSCYDFNTNLFESYLNKYPNASVVYVTAGINTKINYNGKPRVYFKNTPNYNHNSVNETFEVYKSKYIETICGLSKDRKVFITSPVPVMAHSVPNFVARSVIFGAEIFDYKIDKKKYLRQNLNLKEIQLAAAKQCNVDLLDVSEYLCDNEYCYGSSGSNIYYSDDNHLTETGNKLLIPIFKKVFD